MNEMDQLTIFLLMPLSFLVGLGSHYAWLHGVYDEEGRGLPVAVMASLPFFVNVLLCLGVLADEMGAWPTGAIALAFFAAIPLARRLFFKRNPI